MIWMFPIWLALFLLSVGCGLLVVTLLRRLGGASFHGPLGTFQVFWFGYAFEILLLQLGSSVLPIRRPLSCALIGCAILGFGLSRKTVALRLRAWRARPRFALSVALTAVLITLIVAARAAQPVTWYDTLLYHLQVVKWARSFPAVPGIANLHFRLAYDNSIHLFGALTDVFWSGRASHLALGFLVSVVTLQLVTCVLRPAHRHARQAAAFCLLTLPFVLGRVASNEVASLSSDLPLNLICIVIVLELVRWRSRSTRQDMPLALVFALAAVATTTKLGGIGVLAVTGSLALASVMRQRAAWKRQGLALGLLPALLLLGYFARQAIMSGWLLFPAPIGNLHLPWSFPEAETLDQFRWIQSWARIAKRAPADVLDHGFEHWFRHWFGRFSSSQELIVLALAFVIALYRLAQPRAAQLSWRGSALAASLLSLLVWFRGAPDLRFGAGFFWLLLGVLSAPLLGEALREPTGRLFALALSLSLSIWTGGLSAELPAKHHWTRLPGVPARALQERELSPGLKVRVPSDGDDRCGNDPLPCTPEPEHQRLRRPDDLGAGFLF